MGGWRRLQWWLGAVGYCRLRQKPLELARAVKRTVAEHRPGALEAGGGTSPPLPMHPLRGGGGGGRLKCGNGGRADRQEQRR